MLKPLQMIKRIISEPSLRSSGYVIPMSVMADMLSACNLNNENMYNA